MADWFVSSASYAAIPVWQASHAYSIGDIVRPTAPTAGSEHAFRVTTAGTSGVSEPTWPVTDNGTTIISGARFTNITGQAAYGWGAAAGTLYGISSSNCRPVAGDRVFIASDHSETWSSTSLIMYFNKGINAYGLVQIISVNRAGSVPPVSTDVQSGASLTNNGSLVLDAYCGMFWQGLTINSAGGNGFSFGVSGDKGHYFKNCALQLTASGGWFAAGGCGSRVVFDNTTLLFAAGAQYIGSNTPVEWIWINTPNAIQGAAPTILFKTNTGATQNSITCRGVDLSAITGTLVGLPFFTNVMKALFESCKIAPGVTRMQPVTDGRMNSGHEVELVNCWDGSSVINERHITIGDVVTDRSTYMTTGAQDDTGHFALKLTTNVGPDKVTLPLPTFAFDVENTVIGASKTATVEMIAPMPLNNDDISLLLEYLGTSGSTATSFASSLPLPPAVPTALTTSAATWSATPAYSWNPLDLYSVSLSGTPPLQASGAGSGVVGAVRAAGTLNSGKWYFELHMTTWASIYTSCGIATALAVLSTVGTATTQTEAALLAQGGFCTINGNNTSINLGSLTSGVTIGVAVDVTAGLVWFRVCPSGNWQGSSTANPATGVGGASFVGASAGIYGGFIAPSQILPIFCPGTGGETCTANFGGSAFSGAVPAGFNSGIHSPGPTKLQVSFVPQVVGRVRGLVRLGHVLTQAWVDPQMTIT